MITGAMMSLVLASQPTSTELTIYNGGFALVKEQRNLNLKSGEQEVAVQDVAQMIEANSVVIKSLSAPGSFSVLEQNYQYDLISPIAILNKAVGSEITFNRVLPNGDRERLTGTLMSAPTQIVGNANGGSSMTWNGMVIQTADGRVILNPSGEIEVSSIPAGLITKPTLVWLLDAEKAGANQVELSYITGGMSWKSDYVFSLDAEGKKADLKGWVTLTNNCGASFAVNKLKLLAGDVQRVQPQPRGGFGGGDARAAMMKADAGFAEEQFADYHLYTLLRPTTVKDKEIKQVSLMEAAGVPMKKRLLADSMRDYGQYQPNEGAVGLGEIKPLIQLEFKNSKENQMGMPLPKGTVKVYQRDSAGSLQLLGEDEIDHTPKEETVMLTVGRAFDVRVDRKRTMFKWFRIGNLVKGSDETFEIEVRNRKETPETVTVWERHWWEHSLTSSSIPAKKLDANIYEFVVDLKPNEVKTITYSVATRW
ncbi:hypothetical protein C0431_05685 [bacterium]|nr:hypothetical protein [bacterium]